MVCTYCGGKTQVINSRRQVKSNQVWRRRKCLKCHATFTSEEQVYYQLVWMVRYPSGDFRPFSRDKLFLSLHECCEHRPTALSDAQGLTETIINKLPAHIMADTRGTLINADIARVAHVALSRFDEAAAVRYYSLHRRLFAKA